MPGSERPIAVVALSGGMDSTTLLATYLQDGYQVIAGSVDYGQRHRRELAAAAAVAEHYGVEHVVWASGLGALLGGSALTDADIEVPDGHYSWDVMAITVVANRNAIFANAFAGMAIARGADVLGLGMHAGDHHQYPDCRPEAVAAIAESIRVCNTAPTLPPPPRIEARFVHIDKTEIARIGHRLGAPLGLSWSCYRGGEVHCGTCATCFERREAFRDAGVPDPTGYADTTTTYPADGGAPDHGGAGDQVRAEEIRAGEARAGGTAAIPSAGASR